MIAGELSGDQILALLHELARRLKARGVHGDIKLVGGAALILQGAQPCSSRREGCPC